MCCKDLTRDVLLILNFSGFFLIKVSTSLKDKKVHMFFNNHDYTLDFVLFIVSTLKYEHKNNTEKPTFYWFVWFVDWEIYQDVTNFDKPNFTNQ